MGMLSNPMTHPLQTNQLVKIVATGPDGDIEREGVVLSSSAKEVVVAFPNDEILPRGFGIGSTVRVKTWDQLGLHEGGTTVLRHLDPVVIGIGVGLAVPASFATIQRRSAFRVQVRLPFTFVVKSAQDPTVPLRQSISGNTEDVSAGGLRFSTDLPLSVGDKLEASIIFTLQTTPMLRQATVVRTLQTPGVGLTVGVQFAVAESEGTMIGELFRLQRRQPG